MFNVNYKNLRLSFNDFHEFTDKDMPQYGEYCLLELKTGDYTTQRWIFFTRDCRYGRFRGGGKMALS